MANSIPLTFRAAPLPVGYRATPEQFKNDIVARLYAESTESISFFASGSVAPTSDVGPWFNTSTSSWWVWDSGTAAYIPMPIPSASLGYIAQNAAPDQTIYTFWIELTVGGKATAIKYYSGGAWKDVYEDFFTSNTAAIAAAQAAAISTSEAYTDAAIAGIPSFSSYPAQGTRETNQSIPTDGTVTVIQYSSAPINPSPTPFNTGTYRYVAPANGNYMVSVTSQFDNDTGTASGMEIALGLFKNGTQGVIGDEDCTPSPNGSRWSPSFSGMVALTTGDYLDVRAAVTDGVGTGAVNLTVSQFSIWRVSA